MKKILAVLMVISMTFALCTVPVSAQENTLEELFKAYCKDKLPSSDSENVRITDVYDFGIDVTFFTATSWLEPADEGSYEVIGDYCVHSTATYYPYHLGVYVATNDEVYSLKEAYDSGVISYLYPVGELDGLTIHKAGEDVELTHRCMDAFAKYKNFTPDGNNYVDCEVYGVAEDVWKYYEEEDAVVFRAHITSKDAMYPCVCSQQRIGGYVFTYGYVIGPEDNPTGLYILTKDGEVIPALKAYEERKISIENLVTFAGGEEDPYNIKEKVIEKLFPENSEYGYREMYAYYKYPSSFSAADPDYILVHAYNIVMWEPIEIIGDYAFYANFPYNNNTGYFVYELKTDTLYTIKEAIEMQLEGIEDVYKHMGKFAGLIGDADKDGKITVKDATFIQKDLAGMEMPQLYMPDGLPFSINDFDRNREVNIKDATAIQKYVAGIDY